MLEKTLSAYGGKQIADRVADVLVFNGELHIEMNAAVDKLISSKKLAILSSFDKSSKKTRDPVEKTILADVTKSGTKFLKKTCDEVTDVVGKAFMNSINSSIVEPRISSTWLRRS